MGCCCKKRASIDNDKTIQLIYTEEEDVNKFHIEKARELIEICILDDYRYRFLINDIRNLSDIEFENFFYGRLEYFDRDDIVIENKREFKFLLLKIDDFNSIFLNWYKDRSKYGYIKKLWLKNCSIFSLVEKSEEEMNEILEEIFQDEEYQISSNARQNIIELKNIIRNSPESTAKDINNYFKDEHPEFYSLIQVSIKNHNNIKEQNEETYKKSYSNNDCYYDEKLRENKKKERENKDSYMKKSKEVVDKLIKDATDFFKGISDKIPDKIKNSRLYQKVIKEIQKRVWNPNNQYNTFGISYDGIYGLLKSFKAGEVIKHLLEDTRMYFQSNPLVAISSVAFSFLNLYESISTFYEDCISYEQNKTYFENRLTTIRSNFEDHISQIKYLNLKLNDNLKEAQELIIKIGREVEQDRLEMINLINAIEEEIQNVKKKNKKSYGKIAGTVLAVIGCGIGTIATGGVLGVALGIGAAVNTTAMAVSSAHVVRRKKEIKEYKKILSNANDHYKNINNAIKNLEKEFEKIQQQYIIIDY